MFSNTPTSQLIYAYKNSQNSKLLEQIGKYDLGFYLNNIKHFDEYSEDKFYNYINKNHSFNNIGIDVLLSEIGEKIEEYICSKEIEIDNKNYFIVRNSWGTDWGDAGYCYLPFEYVLNEDLAEDFWSIKLVKDYYSSDEISIDK